MLELTNKLTLLYHHLVVLLQGQILLNHITYELLLDHHDQVYQVSISFDQ